MVSEAFEVSEFKKNNISYHVIRYSGRQQKRPPVVLIHGLLMGPRFFYHQQVSKLQEFGDVYSINLAGHYPSQLPDNFSGPICEKFIVGTLRDQLEHFNLCDQEIILIGHSTGGLAAIMYTLAYPDCVAGLGILSSEPHGREEGRGIFPFFQSLNRSYGFLGRWLWGMIAKANNFSFTVHKYLLSDVAHDKKRMFAYPNFESWMAWSFDQTRHLSAKHTGLWLRDLYDLDVSERLHEINTPVLLMFSENDPYISSSAMNTIKGLLSPDVDVTTSLIPQTGHLYIYESSEIFENTLENWLNALSREK